MSLKEILYESFNLLLDKPKLFVPRLVSTTISTIWLIMFFQNFSPLRISREVALRGFSPFLLTLPLLVFLGVFVSVMLAEMVSNKPLLTKSFLETLKKWKTLFLVTLGTITLSFLISLPLSVGSGLSIVTGNFLWMATGGLVTLLLVAVTSFSIFFLPISIVKKNSTIKSIKDSMNVSKKNSREVSLLLVLSLGLLVVAMVMQGGLEKLGYLGFALSRLTSAVTTTYLFVVSPKMYEEKQS